MQENSRSLSLFKHSSPLAYPAILFARAGLPLVHSGTPRILLPKEGPYSVLSVAVSADGQRLVSASWDDTIKIWGVK